jgi:integrase
MAALELIGHGAPRDLAFPGEGGVVMSGFSKMKAALDKRTGVKNWVLHDLRRTAASNWQDLSIDGLVISALLNHAIPGVAQVYLRSEMMARKAAALEKWAARVEKIVSGAESVRA